MSLRAAVEEIVKDMEEDDSMTEDVAVPSRQFRSYVKQLKLALKASEGEQAPQSQPQPSLMQQLVLSDPSIQHAVEIEKARASIRKTKDPEKGEAEMLLCKGGLAEGNYFAVDAGMPDNAFVQIGGQVYQRKGNELHHQDDLKVNE